MGNPQAYLQIEGAQQEEYLEFRVYGFREGFPSPKLLGLRVKGSGAKVEAR